MPSTSPIEQQQDLCSSTAKNSSLICRLSNDDAPNIVDEDLRELKNPDLQWKMREVDEKIAIIDFGAQYGKVNINKIKLIYLYLVRKVYIKFFIKIFLLKNFEINKFNLTFKRIQ